MASPQWKAPVQDPAILSYQVNQRNSAAAKMNNFINPVNQMQNTGGNNLNNAGRENGIVEKMLHSYGFIQCCDRNARLFFHFSEYNGTMESIKIGDPVTFQMSVDRRTGKPVAVSVINMSPEGETCEVLSDNLVTGTVAAEARPNKVKNAMTGEISTDGLGSVSYEESGEVFFLPFNIDDVEPGNNLSTGVQILFYIARDKRNGNIRAVKVKLLESPPKERHKGVVCSMKDTFGFIEREDMVKEIFFHYSEYQDNINELLLGDDVDFAIQTRNGKEVAVDIQRLPEGTVIFEDVAIEKRRGRIEKTLRAPHGRRQSDPLAGRIVYETLKGPIEIPYGDKDEQGDYSLQVGDIVEFNIATDRRDKLHRATNIALVEDTFKVNGEPREKDPTDRGRQIAIRIRYLPKGSIQFENTVSDKYTGTVEKEPPVHKSPGKSKEPEPGILMYDVCGTKQTIPYAMKAVVGNPPKYGDTVEFAIQETHRNSIKMAVNVKLVTQNTSGKQQGFIATMKESFGFIETADHDRELFFHFSNVDGDPNDLDLGDEVEFILSKKTAKVGAENIRKLPKGSVSPEDLIPGLVNGKVLRSLRIVNPDQDEYPGVVQVGTDDDHNAATYTFGITSLADKRDFLQMGDAVKFQVAIVKATGKKRATNIAAVRKYLRAKVDSIKGQFGFLDYEAEEGKKLFFHMTEVHDEVELRPGDDVEFVVVQNQRNGKYSACSLRKMTEKRRPERLISRLKSVSEDTSVPRMVTIRQPRGPDGSRGFNNPRPLWITCI